MLSLWQSCRRVGSRFSACGACLAPYQRLRARAVLRRLLGAHQFAGCFSNGGVGCHCLRLASYLRLAKHLVGSLGSRAVGANYSVKWTAANRHGIFMHCVAAATYLKRYARFYVAI